jgi:hypothetical protein
VGLLTGSYIGWEAAHAQSKRDNVKNLRTQYYDDGTVTVWDANKHRCVQVSRLTGEYSPSLSDEELEAMLEDVALSKPGEVIA